MEKIWEVVQTYDDQVGPTSSQLAQQLKVEQQNKVRNMEEMNQLFSSSDSDEKGPELKNPTKLQEKGFQQQTKKRGWTDIFNRPKAKDSLSSESAASERVENRKPNNRTKRIRRIRI